MEKLTQIKATLLKKFWTEIIMSVKTCCAAGQAKYLCQQMHCCLPNWYTKNFFAHLAYTLKNVLLTFDLLDLKNSPWFDLKTWLVSGAISFLKYC